MTVETDILTELLEQKPFLSKVLQTLPRDGKELEGYLQYSQWTKAKNKAHQLKGIFYLLDSPELLYSLQQIERFNITLISTAEFRQQFSQQINETRTKIKHLLTH
ncbi:MAG: hypothetical protein ACPGSM_01905 [Thiolinea sp.]